MIIYGILGFFLLHALYPRGELLTVRDVAIVTCVVTLYGISDEIHQSFVPGRDPSIGDLFADCAGGLLVASAVRKSNRFFFERRLKRRAGRLDRS